MSEEKDIYEVFNEYLKKRGIRKKQFCREMDFNYPYFTQRVKYRDMPESLKQTLKLKIDLDECKGII